MFPRAFLYCLFAALPTLAFAQGPDLAPLKKWVARQAEIRTIQADFSQSRTYRALRDPLTSRGRLLFSAPGSFRWEAGDPPKMIVLRKGEAYFLIQPAKKRAERLSADAVNEASGERGLPMLRFPLAKNYADFNRQFEVISVKTEGSRCHAELLPRDAQARKLLSAIRLDFDTDSGQLQAFEIALRDGSSMRNEFSNVRVDQKIDARAFDYDLTGFEVIDAKN